MDLEGSISTNPRVHSHLAASWHWASAELKKTRIWTTQYPPVCYSSMVHEHRSLLVQGVQAQGEMSPFTLRHPPTSYGHLTSRTRWWHIGFRERECWVTPLKSHEAVTSQHPSLGKQEKQPLGNSLPSFLLTSLHTINTYKYVYLTLSISLIAITLWAAQGSNWMSVFTLQHAYFIPKLPQ